MIAYRIADARHPVFDPTGAMLHGGRWNSPGIRVIYAAETYSGALLELLVHANLSQPPKSHRAVRIEIPEDVKIETIAPDDLLGWDAEDMIASRAYGMSGPVPEEPQFSEFRAWSQMAVNTTSSSTRTIQSFRVSKQEHPRSYIGTLASFGDDCHRINTQNLTSPQPANSLSRLP